MPSSVDGHVSLPKLDLEKWLALLSKPGVFSAHANAPTPKPATPPATTSLSPFPAGIQCRRDVDVAEVTYRKGTIRDLSIELEVAKGAIAVPRFKAVLPGDMTLQANSAVTGDPAKPQPSGDFALAGSKLRDTLAWLEVDIGGIPADRLQTVKASGKMMSAAGSCSAGEQRHVRA